MQEACFGYEMTDSDCATVLPSEAGQHMLADITPLQSVGKASNAPGGLHGSFQVSGSQLCT